MCRRACSARHGHFGLAVADLVLAHLFPEHLAADAQVLGRVLALPVVGVELRQGFGEIRQRIRLVVLQSQVGVKDAPSEAQGYGSRRYDAGGDGLGFGLNRRDQRAIKNG